RRASARGAPGFVARDLGPRALLKDPQLRQVRPADLQIQRPLVRLEPELLSELVLVASLAHVESALPEAARDGPRDRQGLLHLVDALVVRILLPQDFAALRREADPLPTG